MESRVGSGSEGDSAQSADSRNSGAEPDNSSAGEGPDGSAVDSLGPDLEAQIGSLRASLSQRDGVLSEKDQRIEALRVELAAAIGAYRGAVVAANPEVVAELVAGSTIEEIAASLEGARAAFQRAKEAARAELQAGNVSPGNFTRSESGPDPESLNPSQKISLGLQKS